MKKKAIPFKIPALRAQVTPKLLRPWKKKVEGTETSYCRKQTTYNERTPVVLPILVLVENVNDGGGQGVEEGKDGHGDEELC